MINMDINTIIVQAGGKGSRMKSLTRNKPKALVPIDNLPMIFHLFRKFPNKHFVVIGDYKYDVLEKYLKAFADVKYDIVCATGKQGTCAGLGEALDYVPEEEPFLLIWCDLVLPEEYKLPNGNKNYIGIAKDFPCRWSYCDGIFEESPSSEQGVAGYFVFENKNVIRDVPAEGELVRWISKQNIEFCEEPLCKTREYGLKSEGDKQVIGRCRPFNSIEITDEKLVKRPVDEQGKKLAVREAAWYRFINDHCKDGSQIRIPHIYEYEPLTMELINGKNIYEYIDIPNDEKLKILEKMIRCLKELHKIGKISVDKDSFYEAYIGKTKDRLAKVRNLVPFADKPTIVINGRECRNVFYHWVELEREVMSFAPTEFVFLHGDCTFSNMMLKNDSEPIFIDPRGFFGNTEMYGDAAYDWVKLYYSLSSNYDQFNLRRFDLDIKDNSVDLYINSNRWEGLEDAFFELVGDEVNRKQMKLFLSIIWLSLTTYAWEDYDSICGAFYEGTLLFEEALLMSEQGTADRYFGDTIRIISNSLKLLDMNQFEHMIEDVQTALHSGCKVIASGLGKNVPVCEKFVGSMISLGLNANFLHTNSAVHGDMGMIHDGDVVIILSKSGSTTESVYLAKLLLKRKCVLWIVTFVNNSELEKMVGQEHSLIVPLEHEGDPWNIMPNNSTTLNLIVLQGLAMSLATREHLDLEHDFKPNHPGGAIGEKLMS